MTTRNNWDKVAFWQVDKKVSYRKQIARQHSCQKKCRPGRGWLHLNIHLIQFDHHANCKISHTVCAHIGRRKNLRNAAATPLWLRAFHAPRPYDWGRGWSLRNTPFSTCVTTPKLVWLGQTLRAYTYVCGDPRENGLCMGSRLSRSLISLEPTWIHRLSMTSY